MENEFKHDTNVHCQEASAQIQRISFDILLTVNFANFEMLLNDLI